MKKISLAQLRQIIREELVREGVMDNVSPAALKIGQGISQYLSGPEIRQALKGVTVDDEQKTMEDVLNLTRVSIFRDPLEKLVGELVSQQPAQQGQERRDPAQQQGQQTAPQQPQRRASDKNRPPMQ